MQSTQLEIENRKADAQADVQADVQTDVQAHAETAARFLECNPSQVRIVIQMISMYRNQEWYDALRHHLDAQTLVEILNKYTQYIADRICDIPTEPLIRDWMHPYYRPHGLRTYFRLMSHCDEAGWKRCMHALINNHTDRVQHILASCYCPYRMLLPLFSILQEYGIDQLPQPQNTMERLHDCILSCGTTLDVQVWLQKYCTREWFRHVYNNQHIRDPVYQVLGSGRSLEDMSFIINIVYAYIKLEMGTYVPINSFVADLNHIEQLKLLSYWIPQVSYEIMMDVLNDLTDNYARSRNGDLVPSHDRQTIQHFVDEIRQHRDGISHCLHQHVLTVLVPLVECYLG